MTATTQERPGWGPEAAHKSFGGDTHSLRDNGPVRLAPAVVDEISQFAVRMFEDAIADAQPCMWDKRAEDLENARPRPGDFHGQATREDLADRYARLTEQAAACRLHARFLREYPSPIGEDLAALVVAIIGGDPR